MMDLSIFGLSARIVASKTFPDGFTVTEWADDADPLDSPDLEVAESAMGPNGDFVVWSRPMGIEVSMNVIPLSQGDTNLDILLSSNRVAKNKFGSRDVISIVWTYPNGMLVTASSGKLISGPIIPNGTNNGRIKTRRYVFRFEQLTKANQQPVYG